MPARRPTPHKVWDAKPKKKKARNQRPPQKPKKKTVQGGHVAKPRQVHRPREEDEAVTSEPTHFVVIIPDDL